MTHGSLFFIQSRASVEFTHLGIKNIIDKNVDKEELFSAMEAALKNKKYYSENILDLLTESELNYNKATEIAHLTPTEIEIVKLIAQGLTAKEIASRKHISFHTVMSHRKNIFKKLSINNSPELIMYAIRTGLIDNIEYYI